MVDDSGEPTDHAAVSSPTPLPSEPPATDPAPTDPGDPAAGSWPWRHRRALIALLGGAVSALATPPTDIYPCMFLGMAMLAYALRGTTSGWRGFGYGLLWGSGGGLVAMRFVPSVIQLFTDLGTPLALLAHVLLSVAQSLHWALGGALAVVLRRRLRTPLELAFGAGVMLALLMPGVFIWSPAGLLSPWPALLQLAEYIGERGVSVLFAIIAALVVRAAYAVREHGWKTRAAAIPAATAAAILGLMLMHGRISMAAWSEGGSASATSDETLRVGLVQAAVDPKQRWKRQQWPRILQALREQTEAVEQKDVAVTIWPEAAYPYPLSHDAKRMPRGRQRIRGGSVRGPVLFGYIALAPAVPLAGGGYERNRYNSASLVDRAGSLQPSYDKMELLLFGEAIPFADELPWLRRTFQRSGGLIPGEQIRPLSIPRTDAEPARVAVLNCYEDTLPDLGRRLARELDPALLVNVTNDAWFVGTVEPELHIRLAVMRSIELRRDTVRSVNLGVSGWIDAAGRIRLRQPIDAAGHSVVTPTLRYGPPTLYVRFGDVPVAVMLLLGVGGVWWRGRNAAV